MFETMYFDIAKNGEMFGKLKSTNLLVIMHIPGKSSLINFCADI